MRRWVLLTMICTATFSVANEKVYQDFTTFCKKHFGANNEPLVREVFGKSLAFVVSGRYLHASRSSATVGFETNLPSTGYIEYGTTSSYGHKTETNERPYSLHLRYLKGLEPDTLYHYRIVAVDESGKRRTSRDTTFRTSLRPEAIEIPSTLSAPYVLDKAGAYYLVTKDLTVDGMAFEVKAKNVTLDLGGHTVTYNNKKWPTIQGDYWKWIKQAKFGIKVFKQSGFKLFNGSILQGKGQNSPQANSIGYNPIYLNGARQIRISGVTMEYAASQQIGIYFHWGGDDAEIDHNVFIDKGKELINRHGAGSRALRLAAKSGSKVHHNLVKRTRQSGLGGNRVHDNEIYIDSWTTNSFGVGLSEGGEAFNNKVFGTGYHVVAFGWGNKLTFHNNFVHLEGQKPNDRFKEFGDQISLNGFRLTQYSGSKKPYHDNHYHDNTVIVTGRGASQARGVQIFSDPHVTNLRFNNNTLKALVRDQQTKQLACVVTQGLAKRTDAHVPVIYRGNTFISNICNVRFGDYYGVGSKHYFYGCKFVRVGNDPRYRTFLWDSGYPSKNHIIRDPTFEGGASLDSIELGSGDHDLTVEWTLTVKTASGATVSIKNAQGERAFAGTANAQGHIAVALPQYRISTKGKQVFSPYEVTVNIGTKTTTATVANTSKSTIQLR